LASYLSDNVDGLALDPAGSLYVTGASAIVKVRTDTGSVIDLLNLKK
jgi:hypothetical protein